LYNHKTGNGKYLDTYFKGNFFNLYKTFQFEWEVAKKIILKVVKSITGINSSLISGEVIRDTNRILNKISEIAVKIEDINVGVEVVQGYFS
jgi:hypothetical protein